METASFTYEKGKKCQAVRRGWQEGKNDRRRSGAAAGAPRPAHLLLVNAEDLRQFCNGRVLVNGDENFVEQRLEIVTEHPVHDKALQRRHLDAICIVHWRMEKHQLLSVQA